MCKLKNIKGNKMEDKIIMLVLLVIGFGVVLAGMWDGEV